MTHSLNFVQDYWVDAWQRSILTLDLLRERGNISIDDKPVDPAKPPFIVIDPRAGHGPGIGGMKQDSEIGVAMAAGHPCYFVGFLPTPEPGQTIEDVCAAEAAFLDEIARLHPE